MLENAYKVTVRVKGTSPLVQKRPWNVKEGLLGKDKTKKAGAAADLYDERSLYRDKEGYCCIPFHHIRGSLKMAASWVKIGQRNCTQQVKGLIWTEGPMIRIIGASTGKWIKDKEDIEENCFPDKQGKMHYVERPMFLMGWEAEFILICLNGDFLNPEKLYHILEIAGVMYGWGAHRPDNGRFVINKFEVNDQQAKTAKTKKRGRPKKYDN